MLTRRLLKPAAWKVLIHDEGVEEGDLLGVCFVAVCVGWGPRNLDSD